MENKDNAQEFDLDALLSEFQDLPSGMESLTSDADLQKLDASLANELKELDALLEAPVAPVTMDTVSMMEMIQEIAAREEAAPEEAPAEEAAEETVEEAPEAAGEPAAPEPEEAAPAEEDAAEPVTMDTVKMMEVIQQITSQAEAGTEPQAAETPEEKEEVPVSSSDTISMEAVSTEEASAEDAFDEVARAVAQEVSSDATIRVEGFPQEASQEEAEKLPPIYFNPRTRLRELKKKLVAGPEKRYYELSEMGIVKLQAAILANLVIVVLCAAVTTLYTMNIVPEDRLRFVIFTQVLAMLLSALLGSHQMLDGLGELFKGRFSVNTLLAVTFAACCADGFFCLRDLRVPCCAAFSLEMTMALLARYHRRTTEMAQMDTLRKAVRLHSMVKTPDCYEGKAAVLRGQGEVEDFMDHYAAPTGPEKGQGFYALLSLVGCTAIAVFAGMQHGTAMGVQIFATSLLVAVPASFFIALSRPMAILERRLHMVGTVLCGWRGVKGLCGKLVFPLKDEDLFPHGSTKLNGVKFYGERNTDEVISLSASLIGAAGGDLAPVFRNLLASKDGREYPVEDFQDYGTGGIGGLICGEPVLMGSLEFMQNMGVVVPEGTMVNQAVYASIDGELSAVYAISYAKMRSATAGIISLCGCRKLATVMTGGDFMLTEDMIRGKFSVNTRRMYFPGRDARQALAEKQPDPEAPTLALATRDDLVAYAYAVSGARSLRTACRLGMWIHLLGGILGMAIMLVLAILGSTELLTPTHILLYQLVWMIPGLLVTEWTRTV